MYRCHTGKLNILKLSGVGDLNKTLNLDIKLCNQYRFPITYSSNMTCLFFSLWTLIKPNNLRGAGVGSSDNLTTR